jgi:hypothetical protein
MVGYFAALVVDQLTGTGLLDQQNSFLGKVLLHVAVFGILIIRCGRCRTRARARAALRPVRGAGVRIRCGARGVFSV